MVVTGVLISFYVEKHRATAYKDELKNHSLARLGANVKADIADSWINHRIHTQAAASCETLYKNYDRYCVEHRDSIGYHLRVACKAWTIFIDNPEEYLTLRNSGLIELVENDSLILLLQQKYSTHQEYKQWEKNIYVTNDELVRVFNQKTKGRDLNSPDAQSPLLSAYGALAEGEELDDEDFNLIRRRFEFSTGYIRNIEAGVERDSLILKNIEDVLQDYPL